MDFHLELSLLCFFFLGTRVEAALNLVIVAYRFFFLVLFIKNPPSLYIFCYTYLNAVLS